MNELPKITTILIDGKPQRDEVSKILLSLHEQINKKDEALKLAHETLDWAADFVAVCRDSDCPICKALAKIEEVLK